MIMQVAYIGLNRFIQHEFEKEYTSIFWSNAVTGQRVTVVDLIMCIVQYIQTLKRKGDIITLCFRKAGYFVPLNELPKSFTPDRLDLEKMCRDERLLSKIYKSYVTPILSPKILSANRGAPFYIDRNELEQNLLKLEEYISEDEKFTAFYVTCGSMRRMDDEDKVDVRDGVRRLFCFSSAQHVSRNGVARLSTEFGSFISANDQYVAAFATEKYSRETRELQLHEEMNMKKPLYTRPLYCI